MKTTKIQAILGFVLLGALPGPAFGQQRVFNWLPANGESVRLDPADYHSHTYPPGRSGDNIHVDIKAEKPVTIFLTGADEWSAALQHPESVASVRQVCPREHVVETTYECSLPAEAMTLVILDERTSPDGAVFAGLGAVLNPNNKAQQALGVGLATVLTGEGSATRRFVSPNDLHIQYYRWQCVENCVQPQYQWIQQIKEKYPLTSFLKVYGGFAPDHDGEQVSIKIKSPVPMIVAMLPSQTANQLHGKPDALEPALEKSTCQQRGVQSLQFECKFNVEDGPQSLIVVPEPTSNVPKHKKTEIEMLAAKCVANCAAPQDKP